MKFLEQRSLVIVTGASRGFGSALCESFSKALMHSNFILIARDEARLVEVRDKLTAKYPTNSYEYLVCDLIDSNQVDTCSKKITELIQQNKDNRNYIFVHNAGSLGDIERPTVEVTSVESWTNYIQTNFLSLIVLNSAFIKSLPKSTMDINGNTRGGDTSDVSAPDQSSTEEDGSISCLVVNVTSAAAKNPFQHMPQYCSIKAARDMYFKVLSKENPALRVLTYSPGPLETDMVQRLRQEWVLGESVASWPMLDCSASAEKMMEVIKENKFTDALAFDYFFGHDSVPITRDT